MTGRRDKALGSISKHQFSAFPVSEQRSINLLDRRCDYCYSKKTKWVQPVRIEIGYLTKGIIIKEKNIREQDGAPEIIDLIDTEKRGTTKIRSVS